MADHVHAEGVSAYLDEFAADHGHDVLRRMEAEARERRFPIVGPQVGRFFRQLARLRRPRRLLELGSGFGYSAIWWALGAGPEAEIHLTEFDAANLTKAEAYAREAGVVDRLRFHEGDALATARALPGPWDIVFVDIEKDGYVAAFDWARGVQRPGDVLVFDNMLWHGEVLKPSAEHDAPTRAVVETTRRAFADPGIDASLVPLRDGLLVAIVR